MDINCLLCQKLVPPFRVLPQRALFTKPLTQPEPTAVADMTLAYCEDCRHISSSLNMHIPPDELKEKVYKELYAQWMPTGLSPLQQRYSDFFADWILGFLSPGSRVLEIGCHDGYLLGRFSQSGHHCHGVEPSPFASVAQEKYSLPVINDFFHSDQFERESFDLAIVRHVVEHVQNPVDFVRDVQRVVKKGGLLYLEVPNSWWSVEETYYPEFHVDHISYFTVPSMLRLLEICGLGEIVHQEAAASYIKFPFINTLVRNTPGSVHFSDTHQTWFMDFHAHQTLTRFAEKYQQYVSNLQSFADGDRLAVWGAGSIGAQYAIDGGWPLDDVVYVDINSANHGLVLSATGHAIHSPEVIRDQALGTLLIASAWEDDIRKQASPYLRPGARVLGFSDLLEGTIA